MKNMKTITIIAIFLLIGLCLNPIISSNKIIEQTQNNDNLENPSTSEINNINTLSLNEKIIEILKNYILNNLPSDIASNIDIDKIVNYVSNAINVNPSLLRKTLVISQGWNYNINYFKNSKLHITHDLFSFWHYTQASKTGIESKTFVIKANDLDTSKTVESYRGKQTGFMFRPLGLYLFQKNTIPLLSYTLYIGFASYTFITAEESVIL